MFAGARPCHAAAVSAVPSPRATPPDTRALPLHDEIARQARRLWEGYGRPAGRDVAIWLEAERQVLGTDPHVRTEAGANVPAANVAGAVYPPRSPPRAANEPGAASGERPA